MLGQQFQEDKPQRACAFQALLCLKSYWLKQVIRINPESVGEEAVQELGSWEASKGQYRNDKLLCHTSRQRFQTVWLFISLNQGWAVWCYFNIVCNLIPYPSFLYYPPPCTTPETPLALSRGIVFVSSQLCAHLPHPFSSFKYSVILGKPSMLGIFYIFLAYWIFFPYSLCNSY